ncbi:hypothetical protein CTAYLR_000611 [Chrysophaeum taylorii]|uniref:RCC1-like domain-containing protein n=1 Tax=Chrysophaeum taylorii TaxID=2483200 RepID=A0AAD7UID9_9STRA|nr:hypothetical protein CTAYLR_000611 [Chrysophaeum taylorii]
MDLPQVAALKVRSSAGRRFVMRKREETPQDLVRLIPHRGERMSVTADVCEWYAVALTRPRAVRVNICLNDSLLVSPRSLQFTEESWDVPQHVRVRARPAFDELRCNDEKVARLYHYADTYTIPISVRVFRATGPSVLVGPYWAQLELPRRPSESFERVLRENGVETAAAAGVAEEDVAPPQTFIMSSSSQTSYVSEGSEIWSDEDAYAAKLRHRHDDKCGRGERDEVVAMAGGSRYSLFCCYDGKVYGYGENDKGQLGVGDTRVREKPTAAIFGADAALFSDRVVVRAVACGSEHSAALSTSGGCYAWGDNSHGQLGLGDTKNRAKPERVKNLDRVFAASVGCGTFHSMVAGREAEEWVVYAWGRGLNGALGIEGPPEKKNELVPVEVGSLRGLETEQISCGHFHSAVIANGALYTCGLSDSGQLGRDGVPSCSFGRVSLPKRTRLLSHEPRAVRVACGGQHTLVLSSTREIFAFGNNSLGQLGVGDFRARRKPTRVDVLGARSACGIAASHACSAAWTERGLAYLWGDAAAASAASSRPGQPCPALVPRLSYARTRGVAFGASQPLALADLGLNEARDLETRARSFYVSTRLHFRTMATTKITRAWARGAKLFKLVNFVDRAVLENRRIQTKLVAARRSAKLEAVLRGGDPSRSAARKARLAARVSLSDRDLVDGQLRLHWHLASRRRGAYKPFHVSSKPNALRTAMPYLLNFLGLAAAKSLRRANSILRAAFDFDLLNHLLLDLRRPSSSSSSRGGGGWFGETSLETARLYAKYYRRRREESFVFDKPRPPPPQGPPLPTQKQRRRRRKKPPTLSTTTRLLTARPTSDAPPPPPKKEKGRKKKPPPPPPKRAACRPSNRKAVFAPVRRRGALSADALSEVLDHVSRVRQIVETHPIQHPIQSIHSERRAPHLVAEGPTG